MDELIETLTDDEVAELSVVDPDVRIFLNIYALLCDCLPHLQFPKINIVPLVNKPYVNEVTLTGQNSPLKCC